MIVCLSSRIPRILMSQQEKFLRWSADKLLVANFMEMRLGKTLATVRWAQTLTPDHGMPPVCLVSAPTTVLEAWEKELRLERELYVVAQGLSLKKRMEVIEEAFTTRKRLWVLLNYDTLRSTPDLALLPWMLVVLDESTAIKNPETKTTCICCGGVYREKVKGEERRVSVRYPGFINTKAKAVLSGLPSPESELDLFQQMKFLYGRFMGCTNYYGFRSAYFEIDPESGKWVARRGNKRLIKEKLHSTAFVMRRSEVNAGSSRKIKETRYIAMKPDQERMYRQAEDEFAIDMEGVDWNERWETQYSIVQRTWMARIAGGCDPAVTPLWYNKVDELMELLRGELSSQPVVVWFRFNEEISMVENRLRKLGIPFATLIGDTTRAERVKRLDWFRTSRVEGRVLLCQIKLAKFGVDTSVSDTAIYYSMTYSCEEIAQSEERILHPMKKTPLLYLYLASRNTVDEDVIYATRNKVSRARDFVTAFSESFTKRRAGTKEAA